MGKHLNPLEKEFLIKQYKGNPSVKLRDLIYEKLDVLEELLKGYGFLRTHNSFLVNMAHIRGINSYVLTLDDGRQLPVPKARYKQVRQEYTLFVGKEL